MAPVSYTHLDVYKRQRRGVPSTKTELLGDQNVEPLTTQYLDASQALWFVVQTFVPKHLNYCS